MYSKHCSNNTNKQPTHTNTKAGRNSNTMTSATTLLLLLPRKIFLQKYFIRVFFFFVLFDLVLLWLLLFLLLKISLCIQDFGPICTLALKSASNRSRPPNGQYSESIFLVLLKKIFVAFLLLAGNIFIACLRSAFFEYI